MSGAVPKHKTHDSRVVLTVSRAQLSTTHRDLRADAS